MHNRGEIEEGHTVLIVETYEIREEILDWSMKRQKLWKYRSPFDEDG